MCSHPPSDNPMFSNCTDGDLRLIGGPTSSEGTVEVCRNKVWGGVCQLNHWDTDNANVVCSQLGMQSSASMVDAITVRNSFYGSSSGPLFMGDVRCSGSESRLVDCFHSSVKTTCGYGWHAGVRCIGKLCCLIIIG